MPEAAAPPTSARSVESASYALKNGNAWAIITTISVTERFHVLQITSDYGNWSYVWAAPGGPFRKFLIGLADDPHYLVDKLCGEPMGGLSETARDRWKRSCMSFVEKLYVPVFVEEMKKEEASGVVPKGPQPTR